MIKLFDFREGHVYNLNRITGLVHHLWQAVQRLWAKNHIHKRRAFHDGVAFLGGNTATDTNLQVWIGRFQVLPAAQLVEDFLLCLLTDRAGIQQNDVSLFRVVRDHHFMAFTQHVGHT